MGCEILAGICLAFLTESKQYRISFDLTRQKDLFGYRPKVCQITLILETLPRAQQGEHMKTDLNNPSVSLRPLFSLKYEVVPNIFRNTRKVGF